MIHKKKELTLWLWSIIMDDDNNNNISGNNSSDDCSNDDCECHNVDNSYWLAYLWHLQFVSFLELLYLVSGIVWLHDQHN